MKTDIDPFSVPTIFLRIGWMEHYKGIVEGDSISGGGAFVAEKGYGHEIFNFSPYGGSVYGYAQPPRGGHNQAGLARIRVEKLGTGAGEEVATGVQAIWVSTSPQGGAYIVGWYRNATVYSDWQRPPEGSGRDYAGQSLGYYITARSDDAVLLTPDERVFPIPQNAKGAMGQSNIWYADDPKTHRRLRSDVLQYIETRRLPASESTESPEFAPQSDPYLRQRIERAAVSVVVERYTRLGYLVASVERDNVGWDLNATLGARKLKLEVKGLSGDKAQSELTPNEYAMMRDHLDSYRLCVVTEALTTPRLEIFAYSREAKRWESQEGRELDLSEVVSARFSAT